MNNYNLLMNSGRNASRSLVILMLACAAIAGYVGMLLASQDTVAIDWEMVLTEPGFTAFVVNHSFAKQTGFALGMQLDRLNVSAFTGIEAGIALDRESDVRVWVCFYDPTISAEYSANQDRWATSEPLALSSGLQTVRIAFATLKEQALGGEANATEESDRVISIVTGIFFEPLVADVELEMSHMALFRSMDVGSDIYRTIDGFSPWAGNLLGNWGVAACGASSDLIYYVEPTLRTTDAWQDAGYVHHQGGTLEVVEDPTGGDRGLVCQVTVPPKVEETHELAESGPRIERWPGILVSRIYGGVYFPFCSGPSVTSMDIYVDDELLETALECTSGTILLDIFDRSVDEECVGCWVSQHGESQNSSLQVKLWIGSRQLDGSHLSLKYGGGGTTVARTVDGAPQFTPNEWHRIAVVIYEDGIAELYQNGRLVASHETSDEVAGGTTGGHPGLYIHDARERGPYAVRGLFLYDNYTIQCGPDVDIDAIINGR